AAFLPEMRGREIIRFQQGGRLLFRFADISVEKGRSLGCARETFYPRAARSLVESLGGWQAEERCAGVCRSRAAKPTLVRPSDGALVEHAPFTQDDPAVRIQAKPIPRGGST